MKSSDFEVVIVGAGHAGIEACLAAARLGLKTAMVTSNRSRIGYMSCNPAIGGLAKGHMVREIDILGGEMGAATDASCIQFKRLNSGKGPAVRGSRAQCDKDIYSEYMIKCLSSQSNLSIFESEVKSLALDGNRCLGVILADGSKILSRATVITTGTFMNGVMHVGLEKTSGGRAGDKASVGLSDQLKEFGFNVRRLKTGTPARLLKESIDWSKTTAQYGDKEFFPFSLRSRAEPVLPQIACFLSRTTEETHQIIRDNLHLSPMYCGEIEGVGPRYCPSIEDKIVRFAEKTNHQTFLEPEGLKSDLIYLQGISTSLPADVQDRFLKTIPGLEKVKVARYGYAVEYDFIEPTQIWHRLETRTIKGLFLAGQINGTSGYEEAAAQGLIAGINAAHFVLDRNELVFGRDQAYIGVLIDDLVTKGTLEPYRMFTSRAEHRLVLREDNTIDRLSSVSSNIGLVSEEQKSRLSELVGRREQLKQFLSSQRVTPTPQTQAILTEIGTPVLKKDISLAELIKRSEINSSSLKRLGFEVNEADPLVLDAVETEFKYEGYIRRQMELIEQAKKFESLSLSDFSEYADVKGLSTEEVEKLNRIRPRTLGQAQRISGVNPSAIQAIMVYLKGKNDRRDRFEKHSHS